LPNDLRKVISCKQVATRIRILSSADSNSEVTISDGTFGFLFSADNGSVVNVSGGTFGTFFDVANSTVNISGGTFNGFFDAEDGSTVIFSGGGLLAMISKPKMAARLPSLEGHSATVSTSVARSTSPEEHLAKISRTICNHWNLVQTNFESQEKALR